MRSLLTAVTVLGLFANVVAAAEKSDSKTVPKKDVPKAEKTKEKEKPTLKVGDAPPKLKVDKWLQGAAVRQFDPGKMYVVEFWATWCGPCIMMMPHMADLQREYKDKGVTFIGFTAKDPNNTAQKVAEFVGKRGPKLGYTFAYGDNRDTYNAWMQAAQQNGIPCSFVIDQKGKIAYIGHPLFLGLVLPKVVAGTWNPEHGGAEMAEAEKELDAVFPKLGGHDAEKGLKALADFEHKWPGLANLPFFVGPKISALLEAKKVDEAKAAAGDALAKAIDQDDTAMLRAIARISQFPGAKGHKTFIEYALQASDALLKSSGDKDLGALITAAQVNYAAGNKDKAKDFAKKAREAAADKPEFVKAQVNSLLEKFEDKKDTDKKEQKKGER